MRGKVFISYRRQDAKADARSIYQRLERRLGSNKHLFMDVDTIKRGADFRRVLESHLDESVVLLVLIGSNWLMAEDEHGKRRIDDANDFVRMEIATALKRGIAVIPVLLEGARMPVADVLPDDIKDIVFRQAARVTHENFPRDMESIERDVLPLLKQGSGARSVRVVAGIAVGLAFLAVGGFAAWTYIPGLGSMQAPGSTTATPSEVARVEPQRPQPVVAAAPAKAVDSATRSSPSPVAPSRDTGEAKPTPPAAPAKSESARTGPASPPRALGSSSRTQVKSGVAVRGEEYRIVRNTSAESCMATCEGTQQCRMFAHWNTNTCYLFNRQFDTYPTEASVVGLVSAQTR